MHSPVSPGPSGSTAQSSARSRRWPPPRRVHAGRTLSPQAPGPAPKLWIHRYPVRGRCRPCPTSRDRPCTGPVTTAHRKPNYASQQWRRVLAPEAHRTPGRRAVIRAQTDRSAARFAPIDSRLGCIFMHHQTWDECSLLPRIGRGQGWRVAPRATSAVTLCDRKRRGGTVHHFADANPRTIPRPRRPYPSSCYCA